MDGKGLNIEGFRAILNYIEKHHSFRKAMGKRIKYVSPTCDMRTGEIFHVNLRLSGKGKNFSLTNENKNKDLFEWITDWLDNGSWEDEL